MKDLKNIDNSCNLSLTVPNTQKGYFNEIVIFDDTNELYKYSFSNSLDDIEVAIYARTGCEIKLRKATWLINDNLSVKVRQLMSDHNLKYSMTTYTVNKRNFFAVNMRCGDLWFIAKYEEIFIKNEGSKYYDYNISNTMEFTINSLQEWASEDDESEDQTE